MPKQGKAAQVELLPAGAAAVGRCRALQAGRCSIQARLVHSPGPSTNPHYRAQRRQQRHENPKAKPLPVLPTSAGQPCLASLALAEMCAAICTVFMCK